MNYSLQFFKLSVFLFISMISVMHAQELMIKPYQSWQERFNNVVRSDMAKFDTMFHKQLGMEDKKITIEMPAKEEISAGNVYSYFPRIALISDPKLSPIHTPTQVQTTNTTSLSFQEKIFLIGRCLIELSNMLRKGIKRFAFSKGVGGVVPVVIALGVRHMAKEDKEKLDLSAKNTLAYLLSSAHNIETFISNKLADYYITKK